MAEVVVGVPLSEPPPETLHVTPAPFESCATEAVIARNEHAGFLRLGAGIARKGWLEQTDVVNTLTLEMLSQELKRKRL